MAKQKLFDVLAGKADETFAYGGVNFYAAPLTIAEWTEMAALSENNDEELLNFLAAKMRARVVSPTKDEPTAITSEWLRHNVPYVMLGTLQYILMHGKLPPEPKPEAEGKPVSQ